MANPADIIVIGGGILGMLSARQLALAGRRVQLVERHRIGRGTSRAGGGIMAPLEPWTTHEAVLRLGERSRPLLPELAATLARDTGIDPEYRACGAIFLECEELEAALSFAKRSGTRVEVLDEAGLAAVEPAAIRTAGPSLLFPEFAQIRNPRLLDALGADLRRRGVVVYEDAGETILKTASKGFVVEAGRHGRLQAPEVVIAAGAWSARLLSGLGVQLPVSPVRGQILWYLLPRPVLKRVLIHRGHYLIPRHEGVVLAGSTVEDVGFDSSTTEAAAGTLRAAAAGMVPLLGTLAVQGQWAGLRPGSPDGIPIIGPVAGLEGLWVNTGHFRNGVQLAPASAELLAAMMTGAGCAIDPAPFRPAVRMAHRSVSAYNASR